MQTRIIRANRIRLTGVCQHRLIAKDFTSQRKNERIAVPVRGFPNRDRLISLLIVIRAEAVAKIDELVEVVEYDPQWPEWYAADAAELVDVLGPRLRAIEHFGSTAVSGLAAKPIIDILVGIRPWPLKPDERQRLEHREYEYLGEAGVPGREYLRRRSGHATNLAVVEWDSALWCDDILFRDYLRSNQAAADAYARAKRDAWQSGARTLLAYSAAKDDEVAALLDAAKKWRAG